MGLGPLPFSRKMVTIMSKRYPPAVREKAVRLVLEHLDEYESAYAAAKAIGPRVDVHYETCGCGWKRSWSRARGRAARVLRSRQRPSERNWCGCVGRIGGSGRSTRFSSRPRVFRPGVRAGTPLIVGFIDEYRQVYGVESICRAFTAHGVQVAPRTYRKARRRPATSPPPTWRTPSVICGARLRRCTGAVK